MALKLASITGWQEDRRRALALLNAQIKRATRAHNWATEDALRIARIDVEWTLRERAEAAITEGVAMRYAHEAWPVRVAA